MIEQILQADRLLKVDQVTQARDIYARIVELDPGNAIATVGLARCALADGDDVAAHGLAARALSIDPENDMARRMEARLAEILATRGEDVERPVASATPGPREMRPVVTSSPPAAPSTPGATVPRATGRASAATSSAPHGRARRSLLDRLRGR